MSDSTPTPADVAPSTEPAQAQENTTESPKVEEIDWKAKAREWERRAKENKTAADELAAIREASKSAEEKAAERLAAAEKAAAEAEAKALRREIALEHRLGKDDAALLDSLTDEDAIRSLAARLAPSDEPSGPRQPKPDANQGRSGAAGPKSTADSFADFFKKSLPER